MKDSHRYHFKAQRRSALQQQPLHSPAEASGAGIEAMLAASITSPAALSVETHGRPARQAVAELPEEHRAAIRMR